MAVNVAALQSQLREVKKRASDLVADLDRRNRDVKALERENARLAAFEEKNEILVVDVMRLSAELAAAQNERDTAVEYANANEGAARRLQAIKDALA